MQGKAGRYLVELAGADAAHVVRKVTFESVTILGVPLRRDSPRLSLGPYLEDVQFSH